MSQNFIEVLVLPLINYVHLGNILKQPQFLHWQKNKVVIPTFQEEITAVQC